MKFVKKDILIYILTFVLIAGVAYFIYQDVSRPYEDVLPSGSPATPSPAYVIDEVPVDEIDAEFKKITQPSLARVVNVPARYPEFYKVALREDIDGALQILRENPYNFAVWNDLAIYRKNLDDFVGAAEIWEYLIKTNPGNTIYLANVADLYHLYIRDYAKSEARWFEAMENDPSRPDPYYGLYALYRDSYKQDTSAAVDILREGIKNLPNDIQMNLLLGGYYKSEKDALNTRIYYQKALELVEREGNTAVAEQIRVDLQKLK